MNEDEARRLHEQRQREDTGHDRGGCWCCCADCDFDYDAVMAAFPVIPAPRIAAEVAADIRRMEGG
jgi:hypothetical protein